MKCAHRPVIFLMMAVLLSIVGAIPHSAASTEQATLDWARARRPALAEGWKAVEPAVRLPSAGGRSKAGDPRDLNELVASLATRTSFELQLPNPSVLDSRIAEVLWWERRGKVVAIEVLCGRRTSSSATYWSAGQMAETHEDRRWESVLDSLPIATRFWKYRSLASAVGDSDTGTRSTQLYRFHDGVESWVSGQLSVPEAARVAASFREVRQQDVAPILVLIVGAILIFVWPGYAAWSAKRRYHARRNRAAANRSGTA